jgi:hypothetical protein
MKRLIPAAVPRTHSVERGGGKDVVQPSEPDNLATRRESRHRASCSLKGRPVSTEQRPAATNPVSGRGLGRQPGGSNTTDLAENEFGLLAAIVSLLREFGAVCCNRWSFRLVATSAENGLNRARIFRHTLLSSCLPHRSLVARPSSTRHWAGRSSERALRPYSAAWLSKKLHSALG